MALLLVVAVLAGVITGISPCVWPVLPVVLAGSAVGTDRRRPYAIVAGVTLSFCAVMLVALEVLDLLHLPLDLLNDIAPYVLLLLGLSFVVPALGDLVERPFARLGAYVPQPRTSGRAGPAAPPAPAAATAEVADGGAGPATVALATQTVTETTERSPGVVSGFLLGLALGLVFLPCAGPVLTAITLAADRERYTFDLVVVAIAYSLGIAVPLLLVALAGQAASARLRPHLPTVRRVAGVVVIAIALVLIFDSTTWLTTFPGTTNLEARVDNALGVSGSLNRISGEHSPIGTASSPAAGQLPNLGHAPNFTGITTWIGTPHGRPLTLAQLRGKVVLVDFWTYSCINCLRSLPHVEAWYRDYEHDGFVVVGVHSPEFPFEHVVSNVRAAVSRLGVQYPVAVDDNLATWSAYGNEYWPAEYLIDENGDIRHTSFGEGDYGTTEHDIRLLLAARLGPGGRPVVLPPATDVPNRTPTVETTSESYLGYERLDNAENAEVRQNGAEDYTLPSDVPPDELAFGGIWTVHSWEATAGGGSQIDLNFEAHDVYLVMGGQGTVQVSFDGSSLPSIHVGGVPDLYTVVSGTQLRTGLLTLHFTKGVQAYDFTFG